MKLTEQEKRTLKYINTTPDLLSLLYDLDMLPEQLEQPSFQWTRMMILAEWHRKKFQA